MTKYFNKDCFDVLPTIDNNSIDLIFCDLPYKQTNCKWDSDVDINKLWIEFKRIRKDTTPIIFTCTTKFGYELITANPKEFKFEMIWQKSRKVGFLQARKRPLTNHEMVYFFYKKQPKYNYLKYHKYTKKEKPTPASKKGQIYGDINKDRGDYIPRLPASIIENGESYDPALPASVIGNDKVYGEEKRGPNRRTDQIYYPALPASVIEQARPVAIYDDGIKQSIKGTYDPELPASIQPFKSTKPSKHQTGKPVDLMEFLLKYWTDENDVVFDPTMGGGSMGIACKKLNRKFIGCELDKKFYDEFIINIEKYQQNKIIV